MVWLDNLSIDVVYPVKLHFAASTHVKNDHLPHPQQSASWTSCAGVPVKRAPQHLVRHRGQYDGEEEGWGCVGWQVGTLCQEMGKLAWLAELLLSTENTEIG
jgi:hypothetical protein